MSAENYTDTMSASTGDKSNPYRFGGFRGAIRLSVFLGVLVAILVLIDNQIDGGILPAWVAPFATFAYLALIPVGAVLLYVLERRHQGRLRGTALGRAEAAAGR